MRRQFALTVKADISITPQRGTGQRQPISTRNMHFFFTGQAAVGDFQRTVTAQ